MASTPFDTSAQRQGTRKIAEAMAFLRAALQDGQARPASEVEAEARAAGIAHSTLAEARKRLKITARRAGKGWEWAPPVSWQSSANPKIQTSLYLESAASPCLDDRL